MAPFLRLKLNRVQVKAPVADSKFERRTPLQTERLNTSMQQVTDRASKMEMLRMDSSLKNYKSTYKSRQEINVVTDSMK
jgi:hypothetical protein